MAAPFDGKWRDPYIMTPMGKMFILGSNFCKDLDLDTDEAISKFTVEQDGDKIIYIDV